MSEFVIRMATIEDAQAILAIYEPYILETAITFEYDKVSLNVFKERMNKVMSQFPWLVYCIDGVLVGYAYCSAHLERAAFAWDCECSVYIAGEYHRRGIASALYEAMFSMIEKQGYYNIYSLICVPNESSVALHVRHGFSEIGTYYNTAFKLGEWRNLLIMEKRLQSFSGEPQPILAIHHLENEFIEEVLNRYNR